MKKIFSLFVAVACCSMSFGQIISVTDGTLADWDNVPSEYLFKTECAPNASMDGLKSVQVYVDRTYINLLVEVNDDVVVDREWTPFHVHINADNNAATGGYGDQWTTADVDLMFETAIFVEGENYPYNPAVFKWWGANGENGWLWTDPGVDHTAEDGWGALVPEGSMPIGNSQMVDGKIEIQLDYTFIPMPFDETTFTLGFDIQQSWSSVGILPNANDAEDGSEVLAEKLRILVHNQNESTNTSIEVDGISYKITSDVEPYTVEVSSNTNAYIGNVKIPETITVEGTTYTVTSIGYHAFGNSPKLSSITIPKTVKTIGAYAFTGCTLLSTVNYQGDIEGWCSIEFASQDANPLYFTNRLCINASPIVDLVIPNTVTSISDYAFVNCSSLASVTIADGVTSVGKYAFRNCTGLKSVVLPNTIQNVDDAVFEGCVGLKSVTIANTLKTIGKRMFAGCTSLTSVNIPETVTSIRDGAFMDCTNLTSVNIPSGVNMIAYNTFSNCSSLTSITLPEGVTYIDYSAFSGCSSLTSITLPEGVITIGGSAFSDCSSLTSITIPETVSSIDGYAFSGCSSLTSITLPESVTNIGYSAFRDCSKLTAVNIPLGVTSIESSTFYNCTSLASISLPENLFSIGMWAFENCYELTSITIPANVTNIGTYAFSGCTFVSAEFINNSSLDAEENNYWGATIIEGELIDGLYIQNSTVIGAKKSLVSAIIPNYITEIAPYAFENCYALSSIEIPSSVTSIGNDAFQGCAFTTDNFTNNSECSSYYNWGATIIDGIEIDGLFIEDNERLVYARPNIVCAIIPEGITYIDNYVFDNCYSLNTVVWNARNYSDLSGWKVSDYIRSQITSFTFGNSVQHIPASLCYGMNQLTSITIPNSVTSIGDYAFQGCSSLTSITIPNSVTSIGYAAFEGCSSLTSITIPNSVTSIGNYAFGYCSSLTSITIPNSVTSIGNYAFGYCSSLTSITIPNSVTSISDYAFANCYNLAKVVAPSVFFDIIPEDPWGEFPKNLQYIEVTSGELTDDAWLFINRSYKTLNVLNLSATSNTTLADEALKGCYMLDSLYLPENLVELPYMSVADCKHLKSINIPATVEVIGEGAFENCRLLSEVNFAENGALTEIGNWAFYNCHELKNMVIPEGVTSLGYAAFYGCTYLRTLSLPASMQSIADNGFALCEKLEKMHVNAIVPPMVEARTFEDVDRSIPVVVPTEAVAIYKAAPVWKEFNIQGKDPVISDLENTNNPSPTANNQKIIRDGNLVIIRDGVEYNVMGQQL